MAGCSINSSALLIVVAVLVNISSFLSPYSGFVSCQFIPNLGSSFPLQLAKGTSTSTSTSEYAEVRKRIEALKKLHENVEPSAAKIEETVRQMIKGESVKLIEKLTSLESSSANDEEVHTESAEISSLLKTANDLKAKAKELQSELAELDVTYADIEKLAEVKCDYTPTLENGVVTYTNTASGSKAKYYCNTGYTFTGKTNQAECSSIGIWLGCETGKCVQSVWTNGTSHDTSFGYLAAGIRVGSYLTVYGKTSSTGSCNINLVGYRVIVLHFDIRFNHLGNRRTVVLNSRNKKGNWERQLTKYNFPFRTNVNFVVKILVREKTYEITSGGFTYTFPQRQQLAIVNHWMTTLVDFSRIEFVY